MKQHYHAKSYFLGIDSQKKLVDFGLLALLIVSISLLTACSNKPVSGWEVVESSVEVENAIPANYQIGPGDVVDIFVWRNADVSITVTVRPDGKISSPLVEDMQAIGKTPSQLARDIEEILASYIKSPAVTVIVKEFGGLYAQQVRVVGEAAQPQGVLYRDKMTLLDVMIAVGGLTEFSAGNKAKIVRTVKGKQEVLLVRIADLIKNGDLDENVEMAPGDILIIPEAWF